MDNQAFRMLCDAVDRIEEKLDTQHKIHHERIDSLEKTRDEQSGMAKVLIPIVASISGVVSVIANYVYKHL